jgi:chromosome segregation ATPase
MVAPAAKSKGGVAAAARGARSHPWQTEERAKRSTSYENDDSSLGNGAITRRFQQDGNRTAEKGRDTRLRHQPKGNRKDDQNEEYEVDYRSNPTELFQRISHRLWDMAQDRLDSHPAEARVWIVARYESEVGGGFNADDKDEDSDDDQIQGYQASLGGIKWRNLPLHLALLHNPHPAPLKLIQALMQAHPTACRRRNAEGSLPLHLACDNYSLVNNGADGEAVLFALVECYPDALVEVDGEGRTPVDLLERVGKGRIGGADAGRRRGKKSGESIMYFMRRQQMLQQEQANRRGVLGVDDTDEGIGRCGNPSAAIVEAASAAMDEDDQREERSVTTAARKVVSRRHQWKKSVAGSIRARSLGPEAKHLNSDANRQASSDRSRSVDPSLARHRRHGDEAHSYHSDKDDFPHIKSPIDDDRRHIRIKGEESQKQQRKTKVSKQVRVDAREDNDDYYTVSSDDSDYSKLIFHPDEDSSGDAGAKADLEDKLARALRENMSLRRAARHGAASSAGQDRSQNQMDHIEELETALAKAIAKNSSLLESVEDLRQTNALLHERIDTSKDIIDDMRSRDAGLRDKMDRREEELESLRSKFLQAQAIIDDLNAKHSKDQEQIDNCQREARCLKETESQKIEAQAKMIVALKEKITTLKDIVKKNSTTYKKRFDDIKSKAMDLSQEKKALEEELISAKEASQEREHRIAELVSTKSSLREECDELGDRWVKSKKLAAEYEKQIKSLQSDTERAQSECFAMEKRTKELQTSSDRDKAKTQELSTELTASKAQIEGLQDTIKTLEAALQTKKEAGFDTREATKAMQKRIQDAEAQTGKVEADNAVIRKQLTESKFKIQQLEDSINDLNSNKEALQSKLEKTTEGKLSLENSLLKLGDENTTLKMKLIRSNEDGVKYIEELKQLGITIQEQSDTIRQLEKDIGALNVANDGLHVDKEQLREELVKAKATVASLTNTRDQIEREGETKDERILSLERQINSSTTELQLQTSVISDLQAKLIIKTQDYKTLTEEQCDLEREVLAGRQLKLENDSLKKAVNSMQDVASDYRVKIQEISSQLVTNGNESRAKINALKIANKEIQKDVDRLETELDQFKGAKSGTDQALSEVHADHSEMQQKLSSSLAELKLSKAEIDRLHHSIVDLQESIHKVERQRDTAQLDRDGMHLKVTSIESKFATMQSEAEKERQSMIKEINGYQALMQDLENAQLLAEKDKLCVSSNVTVCPDVEDRDSIVLELLQRASNVVDYEPLKGLDLAISRTHREMREASSQLVATSTESVTQISVLRNQNQRLSHQLEVSEGSLGSTSVLLREDELQRQVDNLYDENKMLIEENASMAKSLERIKQSSYARESRALDVEREEEAKELQIDRLIDANHCLQSKSDALSKINEGQKASIVDLKERVDALKKQIESNTSTIAAKSVDQAFGGTEFERLQTENASLRKTNSVLERALNRLTSRAALHQDMLRDLTMIQASLERRKEQFDVAVSLIRPEDNFGALGQGEEEKMCSDENHDDSNKEERQEV